MKTLKELLLKHKGKRAMLNNKESQLLRYAVIEIQPKMPLERSISVIEDVTDDFLVLNYYDAKELHYIPLDKIIKVNVILRDQ